MTSLDTRNTVARFFTTVCVHLIILFVVALFYGKIFFIRKKNFPIFFPAYRFNKARHLFSLRSIRRAFKRCPVFLRYARSLSLHLTPFSLWFCLTPSEGPTVSAYVWDFFEFAPSQFLSLLES
ncbi:unnamed protein product [Parnassius mnemosyne]|uniref:Uncharacterized protein n=1 Tax=Parnassius mnemosyne TaxID=213953 RepID=A0AAV1L1W1_9NEOP